jgi:hypothetical protein
MQLKLVVLMAALAIATNPALGAGKSQTFSGEVSDSMCGAKHMMEGKAGECARACVGKGSSYALVVGDKVYSLQTQDKAAQEQLSKLAGEKAKVMGTADGETIQVSKVDSAK